MENVLAVKLDNPQEIEVLIEEYPYCQPLHILRAAAAKSDPYSTGKYISDASLYAPDRTVLYQILNHPEILAEKFAAMSREDSEKSSNPAGNSNMLQDQNEEVMNPGEVFMVEIDRTIEVEAAGSEEAPVIETIIPEQELPRIIEVGQAEGKEQKEPDLLTEADIENPIFDTVASSDYFTFDRSAADPLLSTEVSEQPEQKEAEPAVDETSSFDKKSIGKDPSDSISKYNDDKLPYTFLWWLHKTRREYAETYQPYASPQFFPVKKEKKNTSAELNQQIIENIFHLQVPLKDEPDAENPSIQTIEFQVKKQKDENLIEKFIKEEPQIQPPKAEKIDTENKARKSSEDNYDLVSETLASIYIDQMLYHKAIDTYKKLSLKFPDKKLYFAGQIQKLQNKIN